MNLFLSQRYALLKSLWIDAKRLRDISQMMKNLLREAPSLLEFKGVADQWKWAKRAVALSDEEISHAALRNFPRKQKSRHFSRIP